MACDQSIFMFFNKLKNIYLMLNNVETGANLVFSQNAITYEKKVYSYTLQILIYNHELLKLNLNNL